MRRRRGRIANGLVLAAVVVVFAFAIAASRGHGFSTWPLWGKALSVVVALVILAIGAARDADSEWPKVREQDMKPPENKEPPA